MAQAATTGKATLIFNTPQLKDGPIMPSLALPIMPDPISLMPDPRKARWCRLPRRP